MARPLRPLAPAVASLFEDDPTRALPSGERTVKDLEAFRPEAGATATGAVLVAGDDDDLVATRERAGRVATLRLAQALPQPPSQVLLEQPPTMPPVAIDVTAASLPPGPEGGELAALVRANVTAFVRHPRAPMLGAALAAVCLVAGAAGLLVGGTRAHAAVAVEARGPRVAVVTGAREEITEGPALATDKAGEEMDEPVLAPTVAVRYVPARRPGFQRPRRSHR